MDGYDCCCDESATPLEINSTGVVVLKIMILHRFLVKE